MNKIISTNVEIDKNQVGRSRGPKSQEVCKKLLEGLTINP